MAKGKIPFIKGYKDGGEVKMTKEADQFGGKEKPMKDTKTKKPKSKKDDE